jgi:hypothetical protein
MKHAHRTRCPKCGAARWLVDPVDKLRRPAKVVYHFPISTYIRGLFARPDLVKYLYTDCGDSLEGHVTNSRGYFQKILSNPHMMQDHRAVTLVGTTDGVPLFDDQVRSVWPVVFRCPSLPDELSMKMVNCHLSLLSGSEYWELDTAANVLRRRVRGPKSMMPHMSLVVDDLLRAYYKGVTTVDSSISLGQPSRIFTARCMLLYWTGDYPAQAAVSGTHSKTCHWCTKKSSPAPEINRRCWGGFRAYLRKSTMFAILVTMCIYNFCILCIIGRAIVLIFLVVQLWIIHFVVIYKSSASPS